MSAWGRTRQDRVKLLRSQGRVVLQEITEAGLRQGREEGRVEVYSEDEEQHGRSEWVWS